MKRLSLVLMVVGLLALGGQAFAELCTVDAVPAATLLVPYFECNLDNPAESTTLFSINNASAAPTIAHVIFWTDWSYPTVDFDIYLTGYDIATVNVCDVFDGIIPLSADAPRDPFQAQADCGDNVQGVPGEHSSPCGGSHSQNRHWDDTDHAAAGEQGFQFCDVIFPNFNNPVITGNALARLNLGHTGQAIANAQANGSPSCVGDNFDDGIARGYITIDNASRCSLTLQPNEAGYFINQGLGIANNINQLWGDWFLVDSVNNFAEGDTLVHIEANDDLNSTQIPLVDPLTGATVTTAANSTGYTFYGRYHTLFSGQDNREPLGTIWGSRYLNGGVFDQTQLIVWRDSTANELVPTYNWCGVGPSWFPLNETEVIAFNEAEDAVEICFFTGGFVSPPDDDDPPCFPWETHRYNWGDTPLDVPFNFGWAYLNLNLPPDTPNGDRDFGTSGFGGEGVSQSYVTTLHSALGRFSVGLQALEIFNACQDLNDDLNGAQPFGPADGTNVIPFF